MTRPDPELSVVVCTTGQAVEPVLATLGSIRDPVELILVRAGSHGEGNPRFDHVLDVFPAGPGYARNRGLALASAPEIVFLDPEERAGREGAVVFPREPLRRAGGFDLSLGPLPGAALELDAALRLRRAGVPVRRDRRLAVGGSRSFGVGAGLGRVARRHRSPLVALRAAVASPASAPAVLVGALRPARRRAPLALLHLAPDAVRAELAARTPTPLPLRHKGKTQFLYRAGDAVLHVHLDPSPQLVRSLDARERIRSRSRAGGIPRVLASGEALDSLWVLEELMPGAEPPASRVDTWLGDALAWGVELAQPPGPPLRESEDWKRHREELVAAAPAHVREPVERAAGTLEQLPSAHMHGDLQRSNLLLSAGGVAAVDWEGAWAEGIPGLDLVFLALLARDTPPDPALVRDVAAGRLLRAELEGVGVGPELVADALLVHLASWAASERRRLSRLGAPPREPLFRPLLEALGPELAGQASRGGRRTTAGRLP